MKTADKIRLHEDLRRENTRVPFGVQIHLDDLADLVAKFSQTAVAGFLELLITQALASDAHLGPPDEDDPELAREDAENGHPPARYNERKLAERYAKVFRLLGHCEHCESLPCRCGPRLMITYVERTDCPSQPTKLLVHAEIVELIGLERTFRLFAKLGPERMLSFNRVTHYDADGNLL